MSTSILPMAWKVATVTALHKKGDRYAPNNYRPVNLTSVVCKMLETIIKRMHFDQKNLVIHVSLICLMFWKTGLGLSFNFTYYSFRKFFLIPPIIPQKNCTIYYNTTNSYLK